MSETVSTKSALISYSTCLAFAVFVWVAIASILWASTCLAEWRIVSIAEKSFDVQRLIASMLSGFLLFVLWVGITTNIIQKAMEAE